MMFDLLNLTPRGNIGGIDIHATLEEIYTDTLQATMHPVERGAPITDHSFKRPAEIVLRCGWSNSGLDAFASMIASVFSGELSASDYISGVYSKLLAIQESRQPITVTTSKRIYKDMLIASLMVKVDEKTSNILMCVATLRQVIMVSTQATTLPPKENQANAASTSGTENTGVKQAVPATPSPGGAAPIGG